MFWKSLLLTSVILCCYLVFFGQSGFPYVAEWKLIDSLVNKKNLPKLALVELNKVYAAAKMEKNEAQWAKTIIYKDQFQELEDRNISEVISALELEIALSPPRVSALLKSIEAEQLFQYLQENRYNLRGRTSIDADTSTDISTWTINKLDQRIRLLYLGSLESLDLLKRTPLQLFDPVLIKGNSRDLRPTLYDLLCWRALDYFQVDNDEAKKPDESKLMDNPALFSEAPYFMHYGFTRSDSNSNPFTAIQIYQQLLRFHAKDLLLDAWIDADISRIQFIYQYTNIPEKDSLYLNALGRITTQFGTLSVSARAWFLQAQWWAGQARTYDPLGDTLHRYDYFKAISLCEQGIKHPDTSEGKLKCEELHREISRKFFSLNMEQVNIPDQPFRTLVIYKNINQLFGRIIQIDDTTRASFEKNENDFKYWSKLVRHGYIRSFKQAIPKTADYQTHRVEISIEALPLGQYALLMSTDSSFSDQAIMGVNSFFNSNIAFVKNNQDYFVVDRGTGHPLQGVKIKSFAKKYGNGQYGYHEGRTYQSDLNGHFRLFTDNNYYDQKLGFYFGKDYLMNSSYISYYRNADEEDDNQADMNRQEYEADQLKDYIFTDRSIYRPGQTVYFKSLMITRDFKTRKYKIVGQRLTKFYLVDANQQKIDSLILLSNDFGSVQGNFHLPQGLLNGAFSILDGAAGQSQTFSVEEYKRPSFYVAYDSVRSAYTIGDSIRSTGSAIAYAGNSVDGAKVQWRVSRRVRYPYVWSFSHSSSNPVIEIGHGETHTDANGKFSIVFDALSEKSDAGRTKAIYTYDISATVTDANGESREASTTAAASYQSFIIVSKFPIESRIPKDSFGQIPVTTRNVSGSFLKEKLTVSMYVLRGPGRLIRQRYWKQPDQFVMDEARYIGLFPFDEYRDELNKNSWKLGDKVFEKMDSTNQPGIFLVNKSLINSLIPGWYVIEFKAMDKTGEEIMDKRFVEITGDEGSSKNLNFSWIPFEKKNAEPDEAVTIETGSAATDLFVIRVKQTIVDSATKYSFYNMASGIHSTTMEIKEADRGGFAIIDCFVKNNRWYSSEHQIQVPWSNKNLQVSYQTWKDKTKPGDQENWKIKISGPKKDQVVAEVMTSMYDASLDQFKEHSWTIPELYPVYHRGNAWEGNNNFDDHYSQIRPLNELNNSNAYTQEYDRIISSPVNLPKVMYAKASELVIGSKKRDLTGAVNDVAVVGYSVQKLKKPDENEVESDKGDNDVNNQNRREGTVQIRKNFNETAFFKPELKTDTQGNVEISFAMPEALTRWKWMILAHTKDLSFGYSEKEVVTQKELMVQTNMPRFFREGDTLLLPVKMANLAAQNMNGTVRLEWLDAETNQPVDQTIGNLKPIQPFTVNASQSTVVYFPVVIPVHFSQPLLYRIQAKADLLGSGYSDGEEAILPVLSNRMLITESIPLNVGDKPEQHFAFEKLLKSGLSNSQQNQGLTVEYTTNPAWYAMLSLPYLMEFPNECAEQTFNRFYANALASHIVGVSPAFQMILEKWKKTDTATILSNLQKNEELKSALLRETPWVLEAQSETQQKKNLILLFDILKLRASLKSALGKLKDMQSEAGGFPWFKGGRDDRYITQYILSGIGRLKKLNAIPVELQPSLDKMIRSGFTYLDGEFNSDFERRDKWPAAQNLGSIQIQYLYMRSLFPEIAVPVHLTNAVNYYRKQSIENWMKQSVYIQGMIALFLERAGEGKTARDILASLKENAVISSELGMYWKSVTYGYYWQEAPVETQSLLIETFQDLRGEQKDIDQMKYWLLQQKHTQHWPTTKGTADACYALLLSGTDWLSSKQNVSIQLGNYTVHSDHTEAGTGYFKKRIPGSEVVPAMGNIQVILQPSPDSTTLNPQSSVTPSWGAVYWQYFENLDKITDAQASLSITKSLFIEKNADHGPVLEAITAQNVLKPGDKLIMRIIVKTDRDLEYVHLKDMRAACLEPVNVLSGYRWQDGMGYYETTQDASTSFFFDRLPKGVHVFEYPVFVTTAGNYSNGISSLECMYAPEFAAHSEGIRIQVKSK